jgi:hypothetical protein
MKVDVDGCYQQLDGIRLVVVEPRFV